MTAISRTSAPAVARGTLRRRTAGRDGVSSTSSRTSTSVDGCRPGNSVCRGRSGARRDALDGARHAPRVERGNRGASSVGTMSSHSVVDVVFVVTTEPGRENRQIPL